jgi:hypothetical protein
LPALLLVAVAIVAGAVGWWAHGKVGPKLETDYQAVLLTNGQVYYGKLHGLGSAYPVLTDVYYVQTGVDPATKQSKSVLLKRGNEWHSPDRAVLNGRQILMVEPVTAGSRVAHLIAELAK